MNETQKKGTEADCILVSSLELSARIGVPDEEREVAQRLTLNLRLVPTRSFSNLGDDLANTVDYFSLTRRLKSLAAERPRKLIETLVEDIVYFVMQEYAVEEVEAELRKYILADTEYVAVRLIRSRS